MKRYDNYKDSGVAWLGEVPSHWEVCAMKRFAIINNGGDYKHVIADMGYPVMGSGGQFAFATEYMYDGEVVLLGRKGTIDKPLYFNGKFWTVDTMFYAVPAKELCCKFLYYQALNIPFDYYSTATTVPSMTSNDLENNPMVFPPLAEQEAIAAYLDEKCEAIDGMVEKIEEKISLFQRLRRAIITRAVTRGLNPEAPLRPSGVDWIGEVPEHWVVAPMKSEGKFCKGLSFTKADLTEQGLPVVSYGQVHSKNNPLASLSPEVIRFIPEELFSDKHKAVVNMGDFVFADTSEDLDGCGNAVYNDSSEPVYGGYHTVIYRRENPNGKFYAYLFQSDCWRSQIRARVTGTKVFSITQTILKGLSICIPPLAEQQAIAEYLDRKCGKIDELVAKYEKQKELLARYKKSLIAQVVTGQRCVC